MNEQRTMDPLLECLKILCKIEKQSFSEPSLIAGLPLVENKLTPQLFIRAAKRAHFSANIQELSLSDISPMLFPVILILRDNSACVLNAIDKKNAEIILPESGTGIKKIPISELKEKYMGYVIIAKPDYEYEERTKELYIEQERSWFWGTLSYFKNIYGHIMIAAFLTNIFVLVAPLFIMNVYDRVVPNQALATLWVLTIGVMIFFIFDLIARLTRNYLISSMRCRLL